MELVIAWIPLSAHLEASIHCGTGSKIRARISVMSILIESSTTTPHHLLVEITVRYSLREINNKVFLVKCGLRLVKSVIWARA